jgi:hypothetical protein
MSAKKPTCAVHLPMSAMGQKRTWRDLPRDNKRQGIALSAGERRAAPRLGVSYSLGAAPLGPAA